METSVPLPDEPIIEERDDHRAVFVIEKCAPGYGQTLGNAFRRALLSSIPGAAITAARIEGVDHEFSTIEHVKEDVIQILLNLKRVALRLHDTNETVRGHVQVSGNKTTEKELTAGDLEFPENVEVANPDHVIATITDNRGKIDLEVEVEAGLGFVPVEKRKKEKLPIGTLALDASFSPIRKVSYDVENMRVGERTDFNRLEIVIETDGSMAPEEAFEKASRMLVDQFSVFLSPRDREEIEAAREAEEIEEETEEEEEVETEEEMESEEESTEEPREQSIDEIGLPTRIVTILEDAGFETVGDIAEETEEDLLAVEGMGDVSVKEVKRAIGKLGVTLRK